MADFTSSQYFLNRECTWVKFNERVLREAIVPSNPLLEQLNFVAIAASNLDEFFMIRVAGVKHLVESGVKHIDIAGMTPQEQFDAIQEMVHKLVDDQYRYYGDIQQKLQAHGLHFIRVDALDDDQRLWLESFFEREIYPVVTPMAVDSSHPFPFLASLNLNLAVLLRRKQGDRSVKTAILPVPTSVIDRIIKVRTAFPRPENSMTASSSSSWKMSSPPMRNASSWAATSWKSHRSASPATLTWISTTMPRTF